MPTTKNTCGTCGEAPVGTGCYHLCPNSDHYYSAEQERADEPFYGMDDHAERYAAERADMDLEAQHDAEWAEMMGEDDAAPVLVAPTVSDTDDIPF